MSDEHMIRARLLDDGTVVQVFPDGSTQVMEGQTDWERVRNMTEEEVTAAALTDPDNPPMTDEEVAKMRRIPSPRDIRNRLHLTQEQFAEQFDLPLGTIRDWEQGRKIPDNAARVLLRVIEREPDAVLRALAS